MHLLNDSYINLIYLKIQLFKHIELLLKSNERIFSKLNKVQYHFVN